LWDNSHNRKEPCVDLRRKPRRKENKDDCLQQYFFLPLCGHDIGTSGEKNTGRLCRKELVQTILA
jgi:hypothetical protein